MSASRRMGGHEGRMIRGFSMTASLLLGLLAGSFVIPAPASAAIANADSVLALQASQVYGNVKWDFTSFDCIELRTYVNSILRDTYTYGCGGAGASGYAYVGLSMENGTWRLQLWSTNSNQEVWAKSYTLPGLTLTSGAAPSTGGIGTAFSVTSTLSFSAAGPDAYTGFGALSTTDGSVTVVDSRIAIMESAHYFAYYRQAVVPLYTTFKGVSTFSYSAAGGRSISALWSDGFTNVTSSAVSVTVTDQYGPTIAGLQTQITDLRTQNNQLREDLNNSEAKVTTLNSALNNAQAISLALGAVALVLAIVGIVMAMRAGKTKGSRTPPSYMPPQGPPPP